MADAKDIHARDQLTAAITDIAGQVFAFNRELRHSGLTRAEALSLSRVYLRHHLEFIYSRIQITGSETPPT